MVKLKEIDDNLSVLKKAKEMLQVPVVYEAFLMMMGASGYLKNMPLHKNKKSNHLDQMVFETDKHADQKIQKLRYILKQNEIVRLQLIKQVAKECCICGVSHCLGCLEENLGVLPLDLTSSKDAVKKVHSSRRSIRQVDVQVKS